MMIVGFTGLLVKCVMETVERWCGAVGKVRNAEISVCRRLFVHSKQLCACVCVHSAEGERRDGDVVCRGLDAVKAARCRLAGLCSAAAAYI